MEILLGTVFVASLLGSLHCVGMCGPFALLAASSKTEQGRSLAPTIAYSLGRLVTYMTVGTVAGLLGLALNQYTSIGIWQRSATYVAGGLMILVGGISLARYLGFKIHLPQFFGPVQSLLQRLMTFTLSLAPLSRAATIGALTSLMPCGWLYTFAIAAAGTGSPLAGATLMAVFWAGTVPIMVALMLGFGQLRGPLQKQLPIAMACLVIVLGATTMLQRASIGFSGEANIVSGETSLTQQVQHVDQSQLPCCSDHTTER